MTDPGSGPTRLVVVGGGVAGLAAAWQASTTPGIPVTVLEAGGRWGGKLRTSAIELPDGSSLTVDEGADAFLARVPDAVELCEELGLGDQLTQPAVRVAKVVLDGELRDLPGGSVLGVPVDPDELSASGTVSPDAVERLVREREGGQSPPEGDVAIGPFLTERLGEEIVERLVAPLIGGINAGDVDGLSLRAVTPQLAEAAAEGGSLSLALERRRDPAAADRPVFHALRGGSGQLVGALVDALDARGVDLRLGESVGPLDVAGPDGSWRVGPVEADRVVVATPAPAAARILSRVSPAASSELATISHSSVVLVTFVYRRRDVPITLDASGFLVPRREGLLMTAASWGSSKWAHWDDGEHVVLRVSAGRAGDERHLALSTAELVGTLRGDLAATMGISADPLAVRVSPWPEGFAQYTPGHLDRVERIESALQADCPTVAVAGAAYRGVGIPACIRQGRTAARRLIGS